MSKSPRASKKIKVRIKKVPDYQELAPMDHDPASDRMSFPFLALPLELQDKIMQLVLLPGDVHPPPLWLGKFCNSPIPPLTTNLFKYRAVKRALSPSKRVMPAMKSCRGVGSQKLAVQLLATSKEMDQRGQAMFYSGNTFHLPPGPPIVLTRYFDRMLRPESKNLISKVCFTFSFEDFTFSDFLHIENTLISRCPSLLSGDRIEQIDVWIEWVLKLLLDRWYERLRWLHEWRGLSKVVYSIQGRHYEPPSEWTGQYFLDFLVWVERVGWTNSVQGNQCKITQECGAMYCILISNIRERLRDEFERCGMNYHICIYSWRSLWRSHVMHLLDERRVRNRILEQSRVDRTTESWIRQAKETTPKSCIAVVVWKTFKHNGSVVNSTKDLPQRLPELLP